MSIVATTMSISLDGFVAGPNISPAHPLGEGGERLHDWLFNRRAARGGTVATHQLAHEVNATVVRELRETTGAVIMGRRIFDTAVDLWGDVPYPVPCFVLTHRLREPLEMESGTFTFVNSGIEAALEQARAVASDRKILLMTPDVTRQFLAARLVDEIQVNLVPVLLGKGVCFFEQIGVERIELEAMRVLAAPDVTHITYRVLR